MSELLNYTPISKGSIMANDTKVTLSKGGSKERTLPISQVHIPDLWHIAEKIRTDGLNPPGTECAGLILEVWNLCHDFKRHIQES